MDGWTYDGLWQKAKLYIDRALDEERNGPLFPFWATLGLELLARATLARVHPALLAEPDCLVRAFGFEPGIRAKSVMAKTVFLRCQRIVPGFGEEELKKCMSMIDRRNEELHTGMLAFDALPTSLWLPEFFRICKLLLASQQRSLVDLLGEDEAAAADRMIVAAEEGVLANVKKMIAQRRAEFEALNADQREQRSEAGSLAAKECSETSKQLVRCPACSGTAVITGEQVRASEPRLRDGLMHTDLAFLPTKIRCYSCGLELSGHASLYAAGLGGQYSVTQSRDPVEYYGEQLLEALAEDSAYMNE